MTLSEKNSIPTVKERSFIRKRFVLVIPKRIREKLNLKENEPVEISLENDRIIIQKVSSNIFEKLSEFGKGITYSKRERKRAEDKLLDLIE